MSASGWIGVDLDGTLAQYTEWLGVDHIGEPIKPMVDRVKMWLASGKTVKIFTARMHGHGVPIIGGGIADAKGPVEAWCLKHIGQVLEVTNIKDFGMLELWDDRAVQVIMNTGLPVGKNESEMEVAIKAVSNLTSCGACAEIAFTGMTLSEHEPGCIVTQLRDARDVIVPFAKFGKAVFNGKRRGQPKTGVFYGVDLGCESEAEITVEHFKAAEDFVDR